MLNRRSCKVCLRVQGFLGGNQMAYVFKWSLGEDSSKWCVLLDEGNGNTVSIGQMDSKPTSADLEAMVYNAGAAKSPLTMGAKAVRGLFSRFSK
jgi:hypothetical protein